MLEARSLAQENSGLSSNDDFYVNTIKRTRKPVAYKNKELFLIPSPPADDLEESDDGDNSDKDKSYTPVQLKEPKLNSDDEDNLFDDKVSNSNIESNLKSYVNMPYTQKSATSNFEISSNKKFKYNTYLSTTKSASSPDVSVDKISLDKNSIVSSQTELESDQAFKTNIRRSLTTLKYDVQNIHSRLDVLETLLEKIDGKLSGQSDLIASDVHEDFIIIDNDDDLQKAEHKFINDALYRSNVIRKLSRFSSNSLAETIRKIMQTMFSDSFLMNYSFIGFKGKNTFSTLQCCSIIFEAVRSIKKYNDVPNSEIEKPIKNWMAQATQRLKNKKIKISKN